LSVLLDTDDIHQPPTLPPPINPKDLFEDQNEVKKMPRAPEVLTPPLLPPKLPPKCALELPPKAVPARPPKPNNL